MNKNLGVTVEELDNVSRKYSETKQYIEQNITEV